MILRPYQQAAIDSLRSNFARGLRRQIVYAPTGAGKSVIAQGIVEPAIAKGKRILFAVNRIQLVNQFSERLSRAGTFHGIIRGEDTRGAHASAIVGSIQTIARRGCDPFDVVVIDEAHAAPGSRDYRQLIADHPNAAVIGLTATPFAKGMAKTFDGMSGPLFQEVVIAARISELIEEGYLVDAEVWAPATPDMVGAEKRRNQFGDLDYTDRAAAAAMDKPQLVGDIVQHWFRIAPNSMTVVFASSIAHSLHIVEEFRKAGVAAEHLSAYTPLEERAAILKRHTEGATRVVACAALLREGWDSPECSTLILARPTRSLTAYIQMAGRVLRAHPGKQKAVIIDHSGTALKLGLPTEDRAIELDDGKPKESKAGKEEAEDKLKPCPKCGYVDHYKHLTGDRSCPRCGFVAQRPPKPMAHADGELQKIKGTRDEKQRFFSELLYLCEERGYKEGWAANQYRAKFGVWPRGLDSEPIQPRPETRSWVKSRQIRYAKSQERRVAA